SAYKAVQKLLAKSPERLRVMRLFACYDRIVSSPEDFSAEDLAEGLRLAAKIGHAGVTAYFQSLQAQRLYESGDVHAAHGLIAQALPIFCQLGSVDRVYITRAINTMINAASFAASDGDMAEARALVATLTRIRPDEKVAQLQQLLGDPPRFPKALHAVEEHAGDLLESGDAFKALEWYTEAERIARAQKNQTALCGLLGDKAVAFRRIGNTGRAIEIYEEAITLSRQAGDALNLCRWSGNLGQIYLTRGDTQAAERRLKEALTAARQCRQADQISLAVSNYAGLLGSQQRFQEAIAAMDEAVAADQGNQFLIEVCRERKASLLAQWGERLREEGQLAQALNIYQQALKLIDSRQPEEMEIAAILHLRVADLHERDNDLVSAVQAVDAALPLFKALGQRDSVAQCEQLRRQLSSQI